MTRISSKRFKISFFCSAIVTASVIGTFSPSVSRAAKIRGKSGKRAYPNIIDKTIKAAEKCNPKSTPQGTKFCTGFTVLNKDVEQLTKAGLNACRAKIEKLGYRVINENSKSRIPQSDWEAFEQSTQSALTFHDLKTVVLKTKADFVDCAHEWIHVLQWTKANDKLLSPRSRERVFENVEKIVTEQVNFVQVLEKSGKKAHAIIQAGKAQEAIDHLKSFNELNQTLDEVEAHYFVLKNCARLNCSADDRETAIANLFKRKAALNPVLRAEIESGAKGLIEEKKRLAISEAVAEWKPQPEPSFDNTLEELLKLNWPLLLHRLDKDGLRTVAIDTTSGAADIGEKIPPEELVKLGTPSPEDLSLLRDSKILRGGALAKFVCLAKEKSFSPVVFVTSNSTRASLVHEYIHWLQSRQNAHYCEAVYGQREIDAEFNAGRLDRAAHDQRFLKAQATNNLAEKEAYEALLKFRDLVGKPESLNNELMLASVRDWLKVEP